MKLLKKIEIRGKYEVKRVTRKPFAKFLNPFPNKSNNPVIIHCCYHKIGTVWFLRLLKDIAAEYGMSINDGATYDDISRFENNSNNDIFVDLGSHVRLDMLPSYVGSHMIRDPRDMIISGYYYHLWTEESWANIPQAELRGRTYKEYLNSLDEEEGILAEIRRVSFWVPHMASWNYNNPKIYEIKYEDIIESSEKIFREMFMHYGFKDEAVNRCCQIADKYSFKSMMGSETGEGKKSHLRSGKSGEWRSKFGDAHKKLFKELYPGSLKALGYENNDSW